MADLPVNETTHSLKLEEEATHILELSRTLFLGTQALFGFQLIAVFSERFGTKLESHHEVIHLMAMLLVLLAMALLMSPAAYQRRIQPSFNSPQFVSFASKMQTWALRLLTAGLAADFGVISYAVTEKESVAAFLSLATLLTLAWFWFFLGSPLKFNSGLAVFRRAALVIVATKKQLARTGTYVADTGQKHLNRLNSALLNAGYKYLN